MAFTGNIEGEISAMHETLTLVLARLVDTVEALGVLNAMADHLESIDTRLAALDAQLTSKSES